MNIPSLLRSLRKKFFGGAAPRRMPFRRSSALSLEPLESRTLPSVVQPFIKSVTPPNLTSWNSATEPTPSPSISITFNEAMYNPNATDPHSVTNPANYSLFDDTTDASIAITSVTYVVNADKTSTATLNYKTGVGGALNDGTYTAFAQGADLYEASDTEAISLPGELVVANTNNGTISTINTNATGTPQAAQSYPLGQDTTYFPARNPVPAAVTVADFNGDGIPDVAVANSNTFSVEIFLGRSQGGFNFSPDATLYLGEATFAAGATITGIAADANLGGGFGYNGLPDIVTSDSTGFVNIFENDTTPGSSSLNFVSTKTGAADTGDPYAAGVDPVGIVAANFSGFFGFADSVAVANGNIDANKDYDVTILPGNGDGTFGGTQTIIVGSNAPSGLTSPTGIAAGNLSNSGAPDLAVSGSDGVLPLLNDGFGDLTPTGTGGSGSLTPFDGTGPVVGFNSVAIGTVVSTTVGDIAVTTGGAGNAKLYVFPNDGTGLFSNASATSFALTGSATSVQLADLLGTGQDAALVASPSTNSFEVLVNQSAGSVPSFAAPVSYAVDTRPVALAVASLNNDQALDVVTVSSGATNNSPSFSTVLGNGDGTFAALTAANTTTEKGPPAPKPVAIAVGDVNGDGVPDLVVADSGANRVEVYLGIAPATPGGAATYQPPVTYSVIDKAKLGGDPVSVTLADLTGTTYANGLPVLDIVTADGTPDSAGHYYVSVVPNLGDGTGTFAATPFTFPVGASPTQVVAGAFSTAGGKTAADLVVAHDNATSKGVTFLLNTITSTGPITKGTFAAGVEVAISTSNTNFDPSAIAAGDFNNDGNLDFVLLNSNSQDPSVYLAEGNGQGKFPTVLGPFALSPDLTPAAIAVGDFTRDGFLDVVAVGAALNGTSAEVETLPNNHGFGFGNVILSTAGIPNSPALNAVAVTDVNDDPYPDLVVGTVGLQPPITPPGVVDNLFTLQGAGNGTFVNPQPYEAAGEPSPPPNNPPVPALVSVTISVASDPFITLTTFFQTGPLTTNNLIVNGSFSTPDLTGEAGNLSGWQTTSEDNSAGEWTVQAQSGSSAAVSPLSDTPIINPPVGQYQALLDEYNLIPYVQSGGGFGPPPPNPNGAASYSGSNFLYQLITVPQNALAATLTLDLYIDNTTGKWYSGPTVGNALDYNVSTNNEQVEIDFISDPATVTAVQQQSSELTYGPSNTPAVVFHTTTTSRPKLIPNGLTPNETYNLPAAFLSQYAGQTIALRIAVVNNQPGPIIVGVDNVDLEATFKNLVSPTLAGLRLRNPGSPTGPNGVADTTDPTIVGRVGDAGGVGAFAAPGFVQVVVTSPLAPAPVVTYVTQFDAQGNFTLTLPNLTYGLQTVTVTVQNETGNNVQQTFTFFYQGESVTSWQAVGPGGISTAGITGVSYTSVSGRVTSVAVDPSDPSGNTLYIGSENGGVWKTTDGGADWTPLTDFITNQAGVPVNVPVGAVAVSPINPNDIFVATGDGNVLPDSIGGVGVLVSTDGGKTWAVDGNSGSVLAGDRISSIAIGIYQVPPNADPFVVYVSVVGGPSGPGVFRSLNALSPSSATWTNILQTANMNYPAEPFSGAAHGVPPGTTLASVTSMVLDPGNPDQLTIGLGNIGLETPSSTGGVWISTNANNRTGVSWTADIGGDNAAIPNNTLPSGVNGPGGVNGTNGTSIGRVTVAQGGGILNDEKVFYVLIGNPTSATPFTGGSENFGTEMGLYKTSDSGLNWTKVQVNQQIGTQGPDSNGVVAPVYAPANLLASDAANVGSLVIDPTDPNVVYIGGSVSFANPNQANVTPGLISVNTGDMLDATPTAIQDALANPGGINWEAGIDGIGWNSENNGDDIQKEETAFLPTSFGGPGGYYDVKGKTFQYEGEGVSWYDLANGTYEAGGGEGVSSYDPSNGSYEGDGATLMPATMPAMVLSMTTDAQGRLLIGTEQGLWRANIRAIDYDFTSDGFGIMSPIFQGNGGTPNTPVVYVDTLNGNLQISDLTSVAVDPLLTSTVYSAGYGIGIERTSPTGAALSWQTMGLNGPLGQVDAGSLITAAPDPTAAVGTPTTLYANWSFIYAGQGYTPEVSQQGGATGSFTAAENAKISINDNASFFPVLIADPTKIFDQVHSRYTDELLFGTENVWVSRSSTYNWGLQDAEQPPNNGLSARQGSVITAAAIAPSNGNIFYVGTNLGEVFVSTNNGFSWPELDTGLPVLTPGAEVTGFSVDPNNPQTAFVTYGGTGLYGHVYKTTNGGQTWTNIQGTGTGALPAVPAYSIVTAPQPQPGAPNGHIYVGTEVGAYVSINGGMTWQRLGTGLPNVPVVALNFNQSLEELVVGTQGRGSYLISTDFDGARVVSDTPATPVSPGLSSVTVTFNKAIATFPLSQVDSITAPNGAKIAPTSVQDVTPIIQGLSDAHNVFKITFPAQTADGVYTFVIGPKILDNTGNPMDQNQNNVNGEIPGDEYTFQVVISSTDDGQFITGLYHDLLNESAPTSGFLAALNVLEPARFALLPSVAASYVGSTAVRTQLINDLFSSTSSTASTLGIANLFGVAPTGPQLTSILAQLQQGATIETILDSLIGSDQFFNLASVNETDPAFVSQAYTDLLGAGPSTSQLNAAVAQLGKAEGAARLGVAFNFVNSLAYIDNFVTLGYLADTGVAPSSTALAAWEHAFQTGTTQQTFNAILMGLPAYYNFAPQIITPVGQTPPPTSQTVFIQAVYQQLFNGTPGTNTATPAQVAYWLGQLAAGVTDQQMVATLEASNTYGYLTALVTQTYVNLLGRDPVPTTELQPWVNALAAGYPVQDMVANIISTPEFFTNSAGTDTMLHQQDADWVNQIYSDVGGGAPSTAQLASATGILDTAEQTARAVVAQGVTAGSAYRTRTIDFVYNAYLGRQPTAGELAAWQSYLAGPSNGAGALTRDETLLFNVLGTKEYFFDQTDASGLHTNVQWVNSLYPSLRIPLNSAQAASTVTSILNGYVTQRLAVTNTILSSTQYRTAIVQQDYEKYLLRAPTQAEINAWLGAFASGYTREYEIASLMGTTQFFNNAPIILGVTSAANYTLFVQAAFALTLPWVTVPAAEYQYYVPRLQNGSVTQFQFALTLVGAADLFPVIDSTHGVVNALYNRFTGANATAQQIAAWEKAYTGIFYDIDDIVTANLLATPAYFLKAHPFP